MRAKPAGGTRKSAALSQCSAGDNGSPLARRSREARHERDREFLSHVDAAWLRMDGPNNLMVITSLLTFDEATDFQHVEAIFRDRVLAERRFRQRVVVPRLEGPYWEEAPHFDLRWHLHRVALPDPGSDRELYDLVSELASTPLARDRPL
jgi:hypothetical protein